MLIVKNGIYRNIPQGNFADYKSKGYAVASEDSEPGDKLSCPVCGKEYASENTLKNHLKKEHPDLPEV